MHFNYRVHIDNLDNSLIEELKSTFKGQEIEIVVSEISSADTSLTSSNRTLSNGKSKNLPAVESLENESIAPIEASVHPKKEVARQNNSKQVQQPITTWEQWFEEVRELPEISEISKLSKQGRRELIAQDLLNQSAEQSLDSSSSNQ